MSRKKTCDNFELLAENGRYKESRTNANLKGNLGVSTWAGFTAEVNRSRLLPNIYQGTSIAMQIEKLGTRKIPRNGNCAL